MNEYMNFAFLLVLGQIIYVSSHLRTNDVAEGYTSTYYLKSKFTSCCKTLLSTGANAFTPEAPKSPRLLLIVSGEC